MILLEQVIQGDTFGAHFLEQELNQEAVYDLPANYTSTANLAQLDRFWLNWLC